VRRITTGPPSGPCLIVGEVEQVGAQGRVCMPDDSRLGIRRALGALSARDCQSRLLPPGPNGLVKGETDRLKKLLAVSPWRSCGRL